MPSITSRDYAGPNDLRAMQALVQATWTRNSHLHIGDLVWQRYPREPQPNWPTRLWFADDGIVAWSWVWTDADAAADEDEFYFLVRPDHAGLCDEVIDWAEATNPSSQLASPAHEADALLVGALTRRGYQPRAHGPFGIHTFRTLSDIPEPVLPAGFKAVSMVEIGDVERKVAGHRASWSRFAVYQKSDPPLVSGMTVRRYRDMMRTWPYRPELDFGIEGPDGRIVASCTAWLDEANRVGLFEPVGVDPEFRRMGLSRAMCLATLHALKAAGATLATVKPRGDDDYPVPRHAYASMGFAADGRHHIYQRG
ncbi:MAG TPA: GNAT family N-acetyltransferase [Caulobacteraceae bacterium]|nr:GNAT family N-acetyltransferase [Caulobacteraceae bacterium]